MTDVYERIEAQVVAVGELLERTRRYRPLAAEAASLYRDAARIASQVRRSSRGRDGNPQSLESQMRAVADAAGAMLEGFLGGEPYRGLVDELPSLDPSEAAPRLSEIFADVEPVTPKGPLYFPLTAKRGEGVLEAEAAAETVARFSVDGIEPQRGPGVGGDEKIHPIRFFDGLVAVDAALVLIVAGGAIEAAALRAPDLGEVLVYTPRLCVPFAVGLRSQSPDDWLEVRAGGYSEYRERCRELVRARGIAVEDL